MPDVYKSVLDTALLEIIETINYAIGEEAWKRYSAVHIDLLDGFEDLLRAGKIDMHRDGFAGFTVQLSDGIWSNVGFELGDKSEEAEKTKNS